jgi:hypothetical protein
MSPIDPRVQDMVNPSVMQQLAKEQQGEILRASRARRAAGPVLPRARRRLGWSLIGLGAHLALDGSGWGSERRLQPWRPLPRP